MALPTGSRIGPFEITSPLGVGGMGEVYRARDTRLGRDVALKILPESFAGDPERLARFKREAQVLATLNHPHIGAIYGIEESPQADGPAVHALVLELVEGPTLAERIAAGPLGVDEARAVARQITEALGAAHQQGIVHRDLKPANIKVREDGSVKVLDFGLAKLQESGAATRPGAPESMMPTITTPAATGVGVILGTAAYMAPEQARGRAVDRRVDVWAFGCVLYEMLTGRRAFPGDDVTETIAAVVKSEPDWSALPTDLSPALRVFLRRCLAKNPAERVHDIADVRLALDGAFDLEALPGPSTPQPMRRQHPAAVTAAALALIVLTVVATRWLAPTESERPAPVRRFPVSTGEASLWIANRNRDVAIAPDGSRIAYFAGVGTSRNLYMRALDAVEATPIRQAESFFELFFSPDSRWVAFNDESNFTLRKMPVTGGPATAITKIGTEMLGATWGPDDTIVFATTQPGSGLRRVSSAGGTPSVLTTPDTARGEVLHAWPEFLPGGRALLFTIQSGVAGGDFEVAALDLVSGETKILVAGASSPRFATSGHLIYGADNALRAVAFDPVRLEVLGDPVTMLEGVITKPSGGADFSVAGDGTLAYVAGTYAGGAARRLVWATRDGTRRPLNVPPRAYFQPRISPDGSRIAIEVRDQQNDIWIWDIVRETLTRLTTDPAIDQGPIWTPDGRRIVFSSGRVSPSGIFAQAADGTGPAERITTATDGFHLPGAVTPDGGRLIYRVDAANSDLRLLLCGERRETPLPATPFDERDPALSPDGRWIAFQSNESGRYEVYVRPFPDVGSGRFQVSTSGGAQAVWSPDGRELFYIQIADGRLMGVDVRTSGGGFAAGIPRVVIDGGFFVVFGQGQSYDLSPDGKRFLLIEASGADASDTLSGLTVVINWSEELTRLVPRR